MSARDDIDPVIESHLSPADQEMRGHLQFLLHELTALQSRGVLPPDAATRIVTEYAGRLQRIEQRGEAAASLQKARAIATARPAEALRWADAARQLDPALAGAWLLAIELRLRLGLLLEAEALIVEAGRQISTLRPQLAVLRERLERYRRQSQSEAEQRRQQHQQETRARAARSIEEYVQATRTQPGAGGGASTSTKTHPESVHTASLWASAAAEFLQEHWQKLILCMAVLLIVVSSTAGAHHLLGPLLWRPEGKCTLALVYTLLFAAFGVGLVRWGAEAAGRVVLLTTLGVIPINFALAGELRMLAEPSVLRVGVLLVCALGLLGLSWVLPRALTPAASQRLGAAFFVLSAFSALVAPGASFAGGFIPFLLSGCVFLVAVWSENRGRVASPGQMHAEVSLLALGLLGYGFLFTILRTGLFTPALHPTLYAVPLMLAAVACHDTAALVRRCSVGTEMSGHAGLLRLVSQFLIGVAFCLALARPPEPSPVYSGNTLATALLGLGLFGACLWQTRRPVYLYLAFGALFLAYFGAGYFIGDLVAAIEETARRALGYEERLPLPFKALNGLVFNSLLAGLALYFQRRLRDRELARHCHVIGLPLALCACLLSSFEPKAALLCLTAYSVLFAAGAGLFARPLLVYLACAAMGGAGVAAAVLLPDAPAGAKAVGAAGLGLLFWAVERFFSRRQTDEAYRTPLLHATLASTGLAIVGVVASLVPPAPPLWTAGALALAALLYALVDRAAPHAALTHLAVVAGLSACGSAAWSQMAGQGLEPLTACLAVLWACLALPTILFGIQTRWVGLSGRTSGRSSEGAAEATGIARYSEPLLHGALASVVVVWLLCVAAWPSHLLIGLALALTVVTLGLATRVYSQAVTAHLALANALVAWLCFCAGVIPSEAGAPSVYSLALVVFTMILLTARERLDWAARRAREPSDRPEEGLADLWNRSLPEFTVPLLLVALALAVGEGLSGRWNGLPLLGAGAGALWLTRCQRHSVWVYGGMLSVVAALLAWAGPWLDWTVSGERWPVLCLAVALMSLTLWGVASVCGGRWQSAFYSRPAFELALLLAAGSSLMSLGSFTGPAAALPCGAAAFGVSAVVFVLLTGYWARAALTYAAGVSVVGGAHALLLAWTQGGATAGMHGAMTGVLAMAAWLLAFRAWPRADEAQRHLYWRPCYRLSLVLTLAALPLALSTPGVLLLVGLLFLLQVHSFPATVWLYACLGSLGWAARLAFLPPSPDAAWVHACLVAAFGLWGVGVRIQRQKPSLCQRLQLPALGWEHPLFHAALAASAAALLLRIGGSVFEGDSWSAHPGLPALLALFYLLMMKPYPARGWLHLTIGLLTLCALQSAAPALHSLPHPGQAGVWLALLAGLANLWQWLGRVVDAAEPQVWQRVGVHEGHYARLVRYWSLGLFAVPAVTVSASVLVQVYGSVFSPSTTSTPDALFWWSGAVTLILGAIFLLQNRADLGEGEVLMALTGVGLLAVWWVGTPSSPLAALLSGHEATFYALSTSLVALSLAGWGAASADRRRSRHEALHDSRQRAAREPIAASSEVVGVCLAVTGLLFTKGLLAWPTILTLAVSTVTAAVLAVGYHRLRYALAGGGLFVGVVLYAVLIPSESLFGGWGPEMWVAAGLGLTLAAVLLTLFSTWLRTTLEGCELTAEGAAAPSEGQPVAA